MLKKFGSIKVAIVLLILLIAASIIGTLVPQGLTQDQYREKYGESKYSIMTKLQLLDVYHSYWYTVLLFIFCLNLVTCSTINLKPLVKILKNKNYVSDSTDLSKMAFYKEIPVPSKTNQAKLNETSQQIKDIFSRSLYKLKYSDESINYFERGKISRLGPFVTHASIILILIGGILVGRLGFNEYINVPVGSTVDVPRTNFQIRADDFKAEFYPNSQTPKEYTSVLTVIEGGVEKLTKTIEVNHPLEYRGVRFYQSSYGASDSVEIELSKKSPDGSSKEVIGTYGFTTGHEILVPNTQLKIVLANYVPDFVLDESGNIGSRSNDPQNPAALLELYDGNELKYKSWVFQKFPEFHASKESEYSMKFNASGYYTGLQVSKSPFLFIVWLGFFIMVVGMFLSFYMPYKRIWVKTSSNKIEIGGLSYKNRTGFDKESNRLNALLNRL
ncbi:MAG: cytochrome c biogenesis protein ResB [Candidatus Poribacteria bacterium]